MEKTFYCLLMRYRQNRLENYRADCQSPNPGVKKSTSATAKPKKSGSRNSLTNKPGVVFPQPSNKAQPKPPAKAQVPYPTGGTVSQKKALLEKQVNPQTQKESPYPSTAGKSQPLAKTPVTNQTPNAPPYPTSTVFGKGQSPPKTPTGPVAAATAKLAARTLPYPNNDAAPKGKSAPLGELSPNKQAITKQFASEIEKAFNRLPSPEKKAKGTLSPAKREIVQQTYRPARPLPLVPQRPAPGVPMRSPGLVGPRSPPMGNSQFDDMVQHFSPDGSRSPSIAPSMATPQIYQDMFADAPDDNTSASSYDLTKPLRTNSTRGPLNERAAGNTKTEKLPVLPFRSGKPIAIPSATAPTTPLMVQKEPSRLRIASLISPRAANPLLHAPTLEKRAVSAPTQQRPPPLTSPVLVDKDYFANQRPTPARRRSTFRHEFFRQGTLRESDVPALPSMPVSGNTAPHPLQARMNSMKDPTPTKRKWSARLRPGGESHSPRNLTTTDLLEENVPPMPIMATKPRVPSRKATWTLPTRKPTLPPLQESHAEAEDYPHFDGTGSTEGPIKQSFFAKIFSIKPLSKVIQTTLPADRLRTELMELLKRWEGMGIGIAQVVEDPRSRIIRAKLQSHNSVGLKAMRFKIEIVSIRVHASNAVFSQEKGNLQKGRRELT